MVPSNEGRGGGLMQKPHMDFGMRDDSGLLTYVHMEVREYELHGLRLYYCPNNTTIQALIMIFIQFYYMFRLSISAISSYEYWLKKRAKRGQVSAYKQWV
jgi:hypothetical protein